jgi:acetylglutamate kinase
VRDEAEQKGGSGAAGLGARRCRDAAEGGIIVVKVGGAVAGAAELGELDDAVVVHGGGPQISAAMERAGLTVSFVRGRRVTDEAALAIVRRTLLEVNRQLCELLGDRALGLAGDEIGLRAARVPELGYVGVPEPSRPQAVLDALAAGRIPVVAPLAAGPLNVNADEAATALALGLEAERIVFLSDVAGVLHDESVLPQIDADEADRLLDNGVFEGGIVPKLRAAVRAARFGVRAEIGTTEVVA